jgi:hypothetical protein
MRPIRKLAVRLQTETFVPSNEDTTEAWMKQPSNPSLPLHPNELVSLEALILHIAQKSEQPPFRVERQLADQFNIPNVKCLPANLYDRAVNYMVGQIAAIKAA